MVIRSHSRPGPFAYSGTERVVDRFLGQPARLHHQDLESTQCLEVGASTDDESIIVVEPVALQNGRASTMFKALDESCPRIAFDAWLSEWCPHVLFAIINARSDSADPCERLKDELEEQLRVYSNAALVRTFCFAHHLGTMAREAATPTQSPSQPSLPSTPPPSPSPPPPSSSP